MGCRAEGSLEAVFFLLGLTLRWIWSRVQRRDSIPLSQDPTRCCLHGPKSGSSKVRDVGAQRQCRQRRSSLQGRAISG